MDAPSLPDRLLVTDAATKIAPALEDRIDIVQNVIDLAQALGLAHPRMTILSPVETVNPKRQSKPDASAFSEVVDRGQFKRGIVDGPLAKEPTCAARAQGAGPVLDARVPVVLTSRADHERSRLFCCAVAALYGYWLRNGQSAAAPTALRAGA